MILCLVFSVSVLLYEKQTNHRLYDICTGLFSFYAIVVDFHRFLNGDVCFYAIVVNFNRFLNHMFVSG